MGRGPRAGPGAGRGRGTESGAGTRTRTRAGTGIRTGTGKGRGHRPAPAPVPAAGPPRGRSVRAGLDGCGAGPGAGQGLDVAVCPDVPASPCLGVKQKAGANMKPKDPDEQEIPFRLRELIRSREAMKHPKARKRRAAGGARGAPDIAVPKFRRGKGESEHSYICRMEQEVQRILFLTKNQVQREPEKEAAAPQKSRRKKEFQNKKLDKARKKKEEKKEALLEKSLFQDTVAFGEVVTEPPTLTSRPRRGGPAEQAGRKRLLLTPRLGRVPLAAPVSLARQRIVQEERARVIQAYRDIQRRKQQRREAQAARGVPS
uniref:Coiled-coil domain containing 137 n=1 Tax=Anser cygnoides TaxID=8845 RepID=A0A8B9D0P2_ANSCY